MCRTGNNTGGAYADHQIFGAGKAKLALQLAHEVIIEQACAARQLLFEDSARQHYSAAAHGELGVVGSANRFRGDIDGFDFAQARMNLNREHREIQNAELPPLALRAELIEGRHQLVRRADVFEDGDRLDPGIDAGL
jgi:hypothetical protein